MGKYIGPKLKLIRRLGNLTPITPKEIKNRKLTPGQHKKKAFFLDNSKYSITKKNFLYCLLERQKLRYYYALGQNQIIHYYKLSKMYAGIPISNFLKFLESRFDCILYRIGFAKTIFSARQYINHGNININNIKITVPSFLCKKEDIIFLKKNSKIKNLIRMIYITEKLKKIEIKNRSTNLKNMKFISNELNFSNFFKINEKLLSIYIFRDIQYCPSLQTYINKLNNCLINI